jgi:hypothetical protein
MDPHKRSVTIEVMAADETILGGGRFDTDARAIDPCSLRQAVAGADLGDRGMPGHRQARRDATDRRRGGRRRRWTEDVRKMSARARMFATGQGRKTDATDAHSDAHSVALVGTGMSGLRPVINDEQLAVLRVLVDRRRWLGEDHTRMTSQLHQLLLELVPGGAKQHLSASVRRAGQGAVGQIGQGRSP